MVELTGRVERSTVENGVQTTVFFIPALTRGGAIARARANSRFKGLSNFSVEEAEETSNGYEVLVTSDR